MSTKKPSAKPSVKPSKKPVNKPKAKPSAKPTKKPVAKKKAGGGGRKPVLPRKVVGNHAFVKPASNTSNTGRVWKIADDISTKQGRPAFRKEVMDKAISESIPSATASSQYSFWRTFHGITGKKAPGRAPSTAKPKAPKVAKAKKAAAVKPKAKPVAKPAAKPAKKPAAKPASKPKVKPAAVAPAPVETPAPDAASATPENSPVV